MRNKIIEFTFMSGFYTLAMCLMYMVSPDPLMFWTVLLPMWVAGNALFIWQVFFDSTPFWKPKPFALKEFKPFPLPVAVNNIAVDAINDAKYKARKRDAEIMDKARDRMAYHAMMIIKYPFPGAIRVHQEEYSKHFHSYYGAKYRLDAKQHIIREVY